MRGNWENAFRLGSSNWLFTKKQCACAIVIFVVMIASLLVQIYKLHSNCGTQRVFCKEVFLQRCCRCSCSTHLTLVAVRHTNLNQQPKKLQQNHYCERRCSGEQMENNTTGGTFIQQIYIQNILNMLHTLRFFLFKMPFIS